MNAIVQEWNRCKAYIEAALEHAPTHTIEDVEIGISLGRYIFWPASNSAAITEIHEYPRAKHMHIFLAGGELEELIGMVPMWQSWARFNKCSKVTLCGRLGWKRALEKHGWKADLICLNIPAGEES